MVLLRSFRSPSQNCPLRPRSSSKLRPELISQPCRVGDFTSKSTYLAQPHQIHSGVSSMQRTKAINDHLHPSKEATSNMDIKQYPLSPPTLDELVSVIQPALEANYNTSSISVTQCPDLREAPYNLAAEGLSGNELIMDIGGQPNLFPEPRLDRKFDMAGCAKAVGMSTDHGSCIGAGAGPWHRLGINSELAPNFSWKGDYGQGLVNQTYYTKIAKKSGKAVCERSESVDCALMMNLYGSAGQPGPVLKVTARGRKGGEKSFTDCIRRGISKHYGNARPISLGGVFVVKSGKTNYHVMPDFPEKPPGQQYTFKDAKQLNDWLTYHHFESTPDSPIVCLTVFHSTDPDKKMGLRIEHTHCFTTDGSNRGGHYHYDLEDEQVEYEAYLNTAKIIYRIDRPEVTLERDLHD
ncbi:uncharacterized protein LTR77_007581 [Saxophila tyrrhenica]|uniref:DUF1907 domain-containing protein n=1 Tax=Saxophila tyrrhenica TaxID=1690608 RepID=A0AAV9P5G5_9PEZI|nr:hypothetical protein LTR77_007581 [Saxophila tyrrhenica]